MRLRHKQDTWARYRGGDRGRRQPGALPPNPAEDKESTTQSQRYTRYNTVEDLSLIHI